MAAVVRLAIQVRAMHADDLPTIGAMEARCYEFPWSAGVFGDCLRAGHSCWILSVDAVTAGYGILSMGAGEAHVLNLCIDPVHRGKGLGRHLLGRLLDVARWNGAAQVFLEVRPSNALAIALYESVGFREIGRRPRYYPAREGREEAVVMTLDSSANHATEKND
jgi:ribosomal-protein-alanine N-acetyltransferase